MVPPGVLLLATREGRYVAYASESAVHAAQRELAKHRAVRATQLAALPSAVVLGNHWHVVDVTGRVNP